MNVEPENAAVAEALAKVRAKSKRKKGSSNVILISTFCSLFPGAFGEEEENQEEHKSEEEIEEERRLLDCSELKAVTFDEFIDQTIERRLKKELTPKELIDDVWQIAAVKQPQQMRQEGEDDEGKDGDWKAVPLPQMAKEEDLADIVASRSLGVILNDDTQEPLNEEQSLFQQRVLELFAKRPELLSLKFTNQVREELKKTENNLNSQQSQKQQEEDDENEEEEQLNEEQEQLNEAPSTTTTTTTTTTTANVAVNANKRKQKQKSTTESKSKTVYKPVTKIIINGEIFKVRKTPIFTDISIEPLPHGPLIARNLHRISSISKTTSNLTTIPTSTPTTAEEKEEEPSCLESTSTTSTPNQKIKKTEVIMRITIYSKKGGRDQDWLVLGSQKLTVLRDVFTCLRDELAQAYINSNSNANQQQRRFLKSASFLIENTFYNDMRDPLNVALSDPIISWADKKREELRIQPQISGGGCGGCGCGSGNGGVAHQQSLLGPFEVQDMDKTTFSDLKIRFGVQYAFLHQGDCEHHIVFTDIHSFNSSEVGGDDLPNVCDYPRLVFQTRIGRRKCTICNVFVASQVTYGDKYAPCSPAFWCQSCFNSFHLTADGNLLYNDFATLPYLHELK